MLQIVIGEKMSGRTLTSFASTSSIATSSMKRFSATCFGFIDSADNTMSSA